MEVYLVVAQPKNLYPGQNAPRIQAAQSYADHEEDPGFLEMIKQENLVADDIDAAEIITIEIPDEEINARLYPDQKPIKAEVK